MWHSNHAPLKLMPFLACEQDGKIGLGMFILKLSTDCPQNALCIFPKLSLAPNLPAIAPCMKSGSIPSLADSAPATCPLPHRLRLHLRRQTHLRPRELQLINLVAPIEILEMEMRSGRREIVDKRIRYGRISSASSTMKTAEKS